MEAKRMRFSENSSVSSSILYTEKLELRIWQNLQLSKCYDENLINRLLESTRSLISFEGDQQEASDQLSLENQAISTAINTFGLKKQSFDLFDDSASDDSDQPSTSAQSSSSRMPRSSSSSMTLESEAINSAISTFGLHKSGA